MSGIELGDAPGVGEEVVDEVPVLAADRGAQLRLVDGPRQVDGVRPTADDRRGDADRSRGDLTGVIGEVPHHERLERGGAGDVVRLGLPEHDAAGTGVNAREAGVRATDIPRKNGRGHATIATRSSERNASS